MRIVLISIAIIYSICAKSQFVDSVSANFISSYTTSADSAWERRPVLARSNSKLNPTPDEYYEMRANSEIHNRKVRDWALNFHREFPSDPRKDDAIFLALNSRTYYWANPRTAAESYAKYKNLSIIPIDTVEMKKWNMVYFKLRDEYMNSPFVSYTKKLEMRKSELSRLLLGNHIWDNGKLSTDTLLLRFEDAIKATLLLDPSNIYSKVGGGNVLLTIGAVFRLKQGYGWTDADLEEFIHKAANSKMNEVREWGRQHLALIRLRSKPLNLRHIDVDGKVIDLASFKGKVVLIDFWATWCGSCIEAMKGIRKVYDELKRLQFEVISISINSQDEIRSVLKIRKEIGITWPLLIIGGETQNDSSSLYRKIWSTYGFTGVPQVLLLNKEGLLVEYNTIFNGDNLKEAVRRYQ